MNPIAAALLCVIAQDRTEIRKLEVKGKGPWSLEITLASQTATGSLRRVRHEYGWVRKELHLTTHHEIQRVDFTGKPLRGRVEVETPGVLELSVGAETRHVLVGEPVPQLIEDTQDCVRLLAKSLEILERIDRESSESGWAGKCAAILREIERLKLAAAPKSLVSLHAATYKAIVEILEELQKIGRMIEFLRQNRRGFGGGEPEPDDPHSGDQAQVVGLEGRPLTLDGTKSRIEQADGLRVREFYSWIILLHGLALDRPDAGALNDALKRAFEHQLERSREKLEPLAKYEAEGREQNYVEFFGRMQEYVRNPDPERKKILRVHLTAAGDKVMGRKGSP